MDKIEVWNNVWTIGTVIWKCGRQRVRAYTTWFNIIFISRNETFDIADRFFYASLDIAVLAHIVPTFHTSTRTPAISHAVNVRNIPPPPFIYILHAEKLRRRSACEMELKP